MKLNYLGVPVYMNGQNYYIPSLSYIDFKANYEFLGTKIAAGDLEGAKLVEFFEKLVPIVGLAVRRNYPDVTDEQLAQWLDLHTLLLVSQAIQNASGMSPVSEGE